MGSKGPERGRIKKLKPEGEPLLRVSLVAALVSTYPEKVEAILVLLLFQHLDPVTEVLVLQGIKAVAGKLTDSAHSYASD